MQHKSDCDASPKAEIHAYQSASTQCAASTYTTLYVQEKNNGNFYYLQV